MDLDPIPPTGHEVESGALLPRVFRAGFWAFLLRVVGRTFGLARTIVLARILSPEDFGLFGIALLSISAIETLSHTGFDQALIQKKGDTASFLNTAWTVQIIRGLLLSGVLFFGAPLIASFFDEQRVVLLIQVLGATVLILSLKNIGIIFFRRDLDFKNQFIYEVLGTVADIAVAIPVAVVYRSAWALVFGLLAGSLVRTVGSFLLHSYRPKPRFDLEKARELFSFGRWVLGSSGLVFLLNQGDDLFVGRVLGTTALGLYQMAYLISNLPATEITQVVSQVTFPAFSKLQDQRPALGRAYLKVLKVVALASFPLAGGIAFLAPDLTRLFFGDEWMPMVPALELLVVWGLIRSIGATAAPLFQAVGQPKIATILQCAKLLILVALIYPFTMMWGMMGVAAAVVLNAMVVFPVAQYVVVRIVQVPSWHLIRELLYPAVGTAIMWGVLVFVRGFLPSPMGFFAFFSLIPLGALVYFSAMALADFFLDYGLSTLVREGIAASRAGG